MKRAYTCRADAKINLGLSVAGSRLDGYHEIESIMQQVSIGDILRFESRPGMDFSFRCTDPGLSGPENLVCRAAALLKEQAGKAMPGVQVTLYKNIPVAAGLAGGSSDAAAALLGLNKFWKLGLDSETLFDLAARLGSDVPFCLQGGTALVRGRGEQLEKLPPLPFYWVVLAISPALKFSTADAYKSFNQRLFGKPDLRPLKEAVRRGSKEGIASWLSGDFTNTLETADLPGSGLVRNLKAKLQGYGFNPLFSGSGPTLFMLIDDYSLARTAVHVVEELGSRACLCWTKDRNEEWFDV